MCIQRAIVVYKRNEKKTARKREEKASSQPEVLNFAITL